MGLPNDKKVSLDSLLAKLNDIPGGYGDLQQYNEVA